MNDYPKIRDVWTRKANGFGKCFVCGEPAGFNAIIQTNFFRGDDDSVPVCETHAKTEAGKQAVIEEYKRRKS